MLRALYLATYFLLFGSLGHSQTQFPKLTPNLYGLSDLEALQKQQSFSEFFAHAKDVRPSKRNQVWKDMVTSMANQYLKSLMQQKKRTLNDILAMEELFTWPAIFEDEFFRAKREQIGLNYIQNCKNCPELIDKFWQAYPENPELGLKLAQILHKKYQRSQDELWGYYKKSFTDPLSEFLCQKEPVIQHFWKKLTQEYQQTKEWTVAQSDFLGLIHPDCLKSLDPSLKHALSSDNFAKAILSFKILSHKKSLTPLEKDLFYTRFLLNNPKESDLFNLSWNNLKEIGNNYQRRQQLLERLGKLDPLPDLTFSLDNSKKRTVLLEHFLKNFPEYLDYYLKTCLQWKKGTKKFKNGNPTVECDALMKNQENYSYFDQGLIQQFRQLPSY